jgi:hypothetical protein
MLFERHDVQFFVPMNFAGILLTAVVAMLVHYMEVSACVICVAWW